MVLEASLIFSAQSIKLRMRDRISPWSEQTNSHGMSYGLTCAGYDIRILDTVEVLAGMGLVLATSIEHINMPKDLKALVCDKSTWIRRGIYVGNTRYEPGWRGYPTIEIINCSTRDIIIEKSSPICSLEFHMLDMETEMPYTGKYQDQPQMPVPAKVNS